MTEEKKMQYLTELKLCMSVLEQITEEISQERGESFGMLILTNRYKQDDEWHSYCNVNLFDRNGHTEQTYKTEDLEGAFNGIF